MNYQAIHDRIIDRARGRILEEYTESHHIVPRCLDGSDDPDNLVDLTPKEHRLVHILLSRIYPDEKGLQIAAFRMMFLNDGTKTTSSLYNFIRKQVSDGMRERMLEQWKDEEYRAKRIKQISEQNKENWKKRSFREKQSAYWTDERRAAFLKRINPEGLDRSSIAKSIWDRPEHKKKMIEERRKRHRTHERLSLVKKLKAKGLKQIDIVNETGIPKGTVNRYWHQ